MPLKTKEINIFIVKKHRNSLQKYKPCFQLPVSLLIPIRGPFALLNSF